MSLSFFRLRTFSFFFYFCSACRSRFKGDAWIDLMRSSLLFIVSLFRPLSWCWYGRSGLRRDRSPGFYFVLLRSYVPFCRLLLVCPSCIARVIIKRSIAHDLGQRVEGETHLIANDRHLPSLPNHCTLARQTHPLSGLCGSAASPAPPPRCRRCGGRVAAAASLVAFESS